MNLEANLTTGLAVCVLAMVALLAEVARDRELLGTVLKHISISASGNVAMFFKPDSVLADIVAYQVDMDGLSEASAIDMSERRKLHEEMRQLHEDHPSSVELCVNVLPNPNEFWIVPAARAPCSGEADEDAGCGELHVPKGVCGKQPRPLGESFRTVTGLIVSLRAA